jgi:hypothetical protein
MGGGVLGGKRGTGKGKTKRERALEAAERRMMDMTTCGECVEGAEEDLRMEDGEHEGEGEHEGGGEKKRKAVVVVDLTEEGEGLDEVAVVGVKKNEKNEKNVRKGKDVKRGKGQSSRRRSGPPSSGSTKRNGDVGGVGDWICGACTLVNPARALACGACNRQREMEEGESDGEWEGEKVSGGGRGGEGSWFE